MLTIQFPKILAVEGKDEVNFFEILLKKMGKNEIDIINVGGKDNFKIHIETLIKTVGFDQVKTLAIIRDAEQNAQATFQSISRILTNNGLEAPSFPGNYSENIPKIGIFLMPGNLENGMLEDLCFKTVSNHPAAKCVNTFIDCVKKLEQPPKIISKARIQAFLAAMPKIVNSIGLGANKDYWNLEHHEMIAIRKFLEDL